MSLSKRPFSLIVAFDKLTHGIDLIWNHIPDDMKRFKDLTTTNMVIMGRKTWDTLPVRPLPSRSNVIITSRKDYSYMSYTSLEECLRNTKLYDMPKFIIGGQSIYREALMKDWVHTLYITEVAHTPLALLVTSATSATNEVSGASEASGASIASTTSVFTRFFPALTSFNKYFKEVHKEIHEPTSSHPGYTFYTYARDTDIPMYVSPLEETYLQSLKDTYLSGVIRKGRNGSTRSSFSRTFSYTLDKNTLPLFSTRKMFYRGIVEELLWFLRGQTDSKILERKGVNIWKQNSTRKYLDSKGLNYREGTLGPTYGWNLRNFGTPFHTPSPEFPFAMPLSHNYDQFAELIQGIKKDPYSRRHIISLWDPSVISQSALPPCMLYYQFYVEDATDAEGIHPRISMFVLNRSGDAVLGVPWNIAFSSLLLYLVGYLTNTIPYKVNHTIVDFHIYEEHVPNLERLLSRIPSAKLPTLTLTNMPDPTISLDKFLDELSPSNFILTDYEHQPADIEFPMVQ